MIQSFKNQGTEDLFNGKATKSALKLIPKILWNIVTRKLDQIDSVAALNELRAPPGNHLEALKRDRQGQHSIRINDHSTGSVLNGQNRDQVMLKLRIIIKK